MSGIPGEKYELVSDTGHISETTMRRNTMLRLLMNKVILFLAFNITFILLCTPVIAETKTGISVNPQTLSDFADKFFTKKMSEHHVPGVAIIIVKDGSVLFSKGYGYANIENDIPVDPQKTIFRVALYWTPFSIHFGYG